MNVLRTDVLIKIQYRLAFIRLIMKYQYFTMLS